MWCELTYPPIMTAARRAPSGRERGLIETLASGSLRVKVYAGIGRFPEDGITSPRQFPPVLGHWPKRKRYARASSGRSTSSATRAPAPRSISSWTATSTYWTSRSPHAPATKQQSASTSARCSVACLWRSSPAGPCDRNDRPGHRPVPDARVCSGSGRTHRPPHRYGREGTLGPAERGPLVTPTGPGSTEARQWERSAEGRWIRGFRVGRPLRCPARGV